MERRKVLLVGLVYALGIAALLAAAAAVAGLWPGATAAQPAARLVAREEPGVDAGIPTMRPIWPAGGTSGVRSVRSTRTPTATRPAPSATRQTASAATGTLTPTTTSAAPATTQPAQAPGATSAPPTSTLTPTDTASPPPPTVAAAQTGTVTPTPPASGSIRGQVQVRRAPPGRPLTITLETTAYVVVDTIQTAADGSYVFTGVPDLPAGYNVVFSVDDNPGLQADITRYASWAWLGVVRVSGSAVTLPTIDIALVDKDQIQWSPMRPASDDTFRLGETIQFEWPSFTANCQYWLDITRGQDLDPVWKSQRQPQPKATWNGVDSSGQSKAGEYWWAVGAFWNVTPSYTLTIYSYFIRFVLTAP